MNREIKFRAWDGGMFYNIVIDGDVWTNDLVSDNWHNGNVMQYTGLKDKNGKEIYEGDIVDYGCDRFMPVEFINGTFCICKNTAMPTLMTLYPVIGNIYETPELLKS